MIFQHVFRNMVVKPSGPGALSDSILARALLTSFFKMGAMRLMLIDWLIRFDRVEDRIIGKTSRRGLHSVDVLKMVMHHLLDFLKVLNCFPLNLNILNAL